MTNIDLYGSRYTLIPLMRNSEELNFELNKVYLGSALTSQYAKTQRLDTKNVQKKMNKYETLEVMNDRLKLFRRFYNQTKSKIIVVDFLYEGFEIVNNDSGRLTITPSNQKLDKQVTTGKNLTKDVRFNLIDNNLEKFILNIEAFDKVIINELRLPKYIRDENNNTILKDNIQEINFMNSLISSYEDLLKDKLRNKVFIIPLYEKHEIEGYWFSHEYLNHVKKIISEFSL